MVGALPPWRAEGTRRGAGPGWGGGRGGAARPLPGRCSRFCRAAAGCAGTRRTRRAAWLGRRCPSATAWPAAKGSRRCSAGRPLRGARHRRAARLAGGGAWSCPPPRHVPSSRGGGLAEGPACCRRARRRLSPAAPAKPGPFRRGAGAGWPRARPVPPLWPGAPGFAGARRSLPGRGLPSVLALKARAPSAFRNPAGRAGLTGPAPASRRAGLGGPARLGPAGRAYQRWWTRGRMRRS